MKLLSLYNALTPVLRPFGLPYAGLMSVRRTLYAGGRFPCYRPLCPVISVGNIAWGGSGKTPLSAWLLGFARDESLKAAVLSRGYKANPGTAPLQVRPDTLAERSGDEALMLARAFPEAAIIVFPDRAEAARYAEASFAPDLFILDDGMQHLKVARDINLVVLRPEDLHEDWNRVIPSGPWREGVSALASGSAFMLKAEPKEFSGLEGLAWQRLEAFGKPLFSFRMAPVGLRPLFPKREKEHGPGAGLPAEPGLLAPEDYADRPYVLLSGVGNPAGVEATASRLMGRAPVRHFDFSDHHPYSEADIQAVRAMFPAPLPMICTAKDAVKLVAFPQAFGGAPVWVLETAVEFGPALFTDMTFSKWFSHRLKEVVAEKVHCRADGANEREKK